MKVLYIKNNSERNKAFQLRTTICEKNGQRYVTKEAITPEAQVHLSRMKENREKLSRHIIDPAFKLVDIVSETENSLTFAFVEGESFENMFYHAQHTPNTLQTLFERYRRLLCDTFETTQFDHTTMATDEMKRLFGNLDYSLLDGSLCYSGICNIDMIPSNLIENEGIVHLIDYEWAYELNLPVDYILYRTFQLLPEPHKEMLDISFDHPLLYHKMERHFIDNYVMHKGFYFQKHHYMKVNTPIAEHIKNKEQHIAQLESHLKNLEEEIHACKKAYEQLEETGDALHYAQQIIQLRDRQLAYFRIGNRIKNIVKGFLPGMHPEPFPDESTLETTDTDAAVQQRYHYHAPELTPDIRHTMKHFQKQPRISLIMPVYNVDPKWLEKAIRSIEAQWYENWELCIADDKSTNEATIAYLENLSNPKIKVTRLDQNLNISGASNTALASAGGEYIVLMDNDDELTPDALYEVVKCINDTDADFIYSDEDFISPEEEYINPHFKPNFSPDLLLSHNYITHLSCFKRSLIDAVGAFNPDFDGAQDYDLFLRMTEKTSNIQHIPKVLYHWRMLESSTSLNSEAKPEALERGKRLLEATLARRGIEGRVEYGNMNHYFRVRYTLEKKPLVSIIIPFKDKPELLEMCISSILEKSTYTNYEIIGISNNSKSAETFEMMTALEKRDPRVSFYEHNVPFNYAAINNYAVAHYAKGEHLILLNNDIEVISPEWIEAMLEHSQRAEIGCVGAKLYYPDDTVQHAGIIIGLGGYAGHSHKLSPRDNPGYFNRLNTVQNVSAVTAACLMIEKKIYDAVEGMDEIHFKVAYNDVDFCLRVREKGYLNLFTPYAELYHYESISRGYETTPEKIARFQKEKDALLRRHGAILAGGDPYYNPNLCHDKEDFSLCPKT